MSDDSHSVKFPINEPATARNKSQIQEYIEATVERERSTSRCSARMSCTRWVNCSATARFFARSHTYYDAANARWAVENRCANCRSAGYTCGPRRGRLSAADLFEAVEDRPTVFFEIIQRRQPGFAKQFQGAVRVDRTEQGATRKSLYAEPKSEASEEAAVGKASSATNRDSATSLPARRRRSIAAGAESPQKVAHGLYAEQLSARRLPRARGQSANLAVPHARRWRTAVPVDRAGKAAQRAVDEVPRRESTAMDADSDSSFVAAHDFIDGLITMRAMQHAYARGSRSTSTWPTDR